MRDKKFEEYVKNELGDIAVFDNNNYISEKIRNYKRVWDNKFPLHFYDGQATDRDHSYRKVRQYRNEKIGLTITDRM